MSCQLGSEEHTDRLLAYSAGKLKGDAAAELELHLRGCLECAEFGKAQASVWNLLDAWQAPSVSADFDRRLYARIDAAASASWLERMRAAVSEFLHPMLARPAFPLAAATVALAGGFLLDHPHRAVEHARSASVIRVEVDQVEATLDDVEMLRQFDAKTDDQEKTSKSM